MKSYGNVSNAFDKSKKTVCGQCANVFTLQNCRHHKMSWILPTVRSLSLLKCKLQTVNANKTFKLSYLCPCLVQKSNWEWVDKVLAVINIEYRDIGVGSYDYYDKNFFILEQSQNGTVSPRGCNIAFAVCGMKLKIQAGLWDMEMDENKMQKRG